MNVPPVDVLRRAALSATTPRAAGQLVTVETTVAGLRSRLSAARASGKTVGFVPTMGSLHRGHVSLMEAATAGNDFVVVSIFVNPLQFNAGEDFDDYPRDLKRDLATCVDIGVDVAFVPSSAEMYPHPVATTVSVAEFGNVLCGASRPGHFDGVATVVAKLFAIVGECSAYFGEKDYQQLGVVKRMVQDLSLPVEVVGCPTVREPDGLALSSRNAYLSEAECRVASSLHRALLTGAAAIEAGEKDPESVMSAILRTLETGLSTSATEGVEYRIDYVAAVDPHTLRTPTELRGEVRLLVAVRFSKARLIDNIGCLAPL